LRGLSIKREEREEREEEMKIYYQDEGSTIYHGDCRDLVGTVIADCIITDPPYEETRYSWDKWPANWPMWAMMALKRSGSLWCFGSVRMFVDRWLDFQGLAICQDVVWEKHNGSSMMADRFRRVHELIVQFRHGDTKWKRVYNNRLYTMDAKARTVRRQNKPAHWGQIGFGDYETKEGGPRLMRSVIKARSCHRRALNPTQKPVEVIEHLLRCSCPPGGTVLDCFMGSGSTLVAARKLGMVGLGIDVRESECEKAARRFQEGT
jgi:site-specific DNA-methyltransferase (adenine-specific)